jgi:hypothetical protein
MDFDRFLELLRQLDRQSVDYVLVGGTALTVHGIVRTTEDIDIFVRPEAENIARLKRALAAVWNDPDIEQITLEDLQGEYPTVRYGPPGETLVIDILARLGTTFRYEDIEAQDAMIDGVHVRVATPRMLYRMKRDTVRPIDKADAASLRERFALGDEDAG